MIIFIKLFCISILLVASIIQCTSQNEKASVIKATAVLRHNTSELTNQTNSVENPMLKKHKYSSKIAGSRFWTDNVFGIRIFPVSKSNLVNEFTQTKNKLTSTTENVLDFRISDVKKNKAKIKEKDDKSKKKDMATASAGAGKQKKEADDDEEKTLAQQVADGKYGLIQNEIFANGSKRPGILSYAANTEVPKDTRENFGGLEKDEIWLAEDHILVLRGGNYQNIKENRTPSLNVWPPIDDYKAPNRQVKLPKNPEIPPPFPVQLTNDGPIEFIKSKNGPSTNPPNISPFPPFSHETNKSIPFPFSAPNVSPPRNGNKTFPFPIPPHLLPPFLNNLPPGATFVAPPSNQKDIDEDDPSIYYPPRYDFYYPQDNTTAVPPGPLVPGIILPPPPDFFSLLDNETNSSFDQYNETDYNLNSVTPNTFLGPKYLPAIRKPSRPRIMSNRYLKRPTNSNLTDINNAPESTSKLEKPAITYVFPENSKHKSLTTTTPPQNIFRTSVKVPTNKKFNSFSTPIFVPNNLNQSVYHPLPTTSPKPNHITLPTTKTLPKQIYIITTPKTFDKNRIEDIYKSSKPNNVQKYELISPELHPLRSLIKPNVTVNYNGKYGRLPPALAFPPVKSEDDGIKPIHKYYVTPPSSAKTSKLPSTDINSITVTPIPVIKKIRVHPIPVDKPEVTIPSSNASKATFYFYEEPSTTERPISVQKPDTASGILPTPISTNIPTKTEVKPLTHYYYTTQSTSKTPIRQFLEETFHSSNVLPQKPQIGHINNAEIIPHNSYSEIQKMKHLNYGTHVSPKPAIKYHYVTEDNAVIIPSPKIKDLEIKNSGSIGLQNVNLDKSVIRPASKPTIVQDATEPTQKPEMHNSPLLSYEEISKPTEYKNNDGPFIPSNYYATVRPELIHFTSQEQTLVDDITKNYFTIFGQKINSVSTTPLTPIKSSNEKNKNKPESGLSYISDGGQNFKIQQVHEILGRKPGKSSTLFYTSEKPKASTPARPESNFEKYLKELTGEDQKDYIITGVFPNKVKKGKGFFEQGSTLDDIPPHLLSKGATVFINSQPSVQQVNSVKDSDQGANKPRLPYQPGFSTTLQPLDIEIKPQYIQHISPTTKPLTVYPQILPHNVGISQNFQQYLQEITGLTSPTTTRPIRIKNPNLEYFPTTPSPLKPFIFQHPSFQGPPEIKQKPISLGDDILVNFKRPRPPVNPEAELINIHSPNVPFDVSPNIKIVDSPNLSKSSNQPYSTKQITFGVAKDIFENLPKSGYFSPPHQNGGNSFVSYNLPGNGGHFYFLTPQIVQKENEDRRRQDQNYKRVHRSEEKNNGYSRNAEPGKYSTEIKHNLEEEFSNHDYLRRTRKKP